MVYTYYRRPDFPIGIAWSPTVATASPYTMVLALNFSNNLQEEITPTASNAAKVYRQLPAEQRDYRQCGLS